MTEQVFKDKKGVIIPMYGRDEMNLIEFPFGPISPSGDSRLEIDHHVYDRTLKREVKRQLTIIAPAGLGLPRPIDDQVLVGLKALTYEAGFESRKVHFSRYGLCKHLGWKPDGRAYKRLEESFDRIAGALLKFKDAWWDKSEKEWKSKIFHIIDNVELCSKDRYDRIRDKTGKAEQRLCSFTWNEVVWKSFQDGFIKSLDMDMYRRIASGRRREVPLRLYRILDKRFYKKAKVTIDLRGLCVGNLGLRDGYSRSELKVIVERAASWLIDCGFLGSISFKHATDKRSYLVEFRKASPRSPSKQVLVKNVEKSKPDEHQQWLSSQTEERLFDEETSALDSGYGTKLERDLVERDRNEGRAILESGRIRQEFIRKFTASLAA